MGIFVKMNICFYTTDSLRKNICSNCDNKWNSRIDESVVLLYCTKDKVGTKVAVKRLIFFFEWKTGLCASLCNYISVKNFSQGKELQFFRSQCSFPCGALSRYSFFIKNLIRNLCFLSLLCLISVSFHTLNGTWISFDTYV